MIINIYKYLTYTLYNKMEENKKCQDCWGNQRLNPWVSNCLCKENAKEMIREDIHQYD